MSNPWYLTAERAQRVKRQAPRAIATIPIVAGGDPMRIGPSLLGSPPATSFSIAGPVVMVTLALRLIASITTGYS